MRILVIGSGGREHALAWKLAQSPQVGEILVAPGNGGTAAIARNVNINVGDIDALVALAKKERVDLVVPGPELPLTLGIVDALENAGIPVFGPDKYASQLEGSKSFAKEIMAACGVPTAKSMVFTDCHKALEYVENADGPLVIKADGLAAGKGVIICNTREEAANAAREMLAGNRFGAAASKILIEEKLEGEEVSLLCLCDGQTCLPLSSAQDHKAVFDGDQGPNTGGMGAYSPAPILPDERLEEMADLVIRPILKEMATRGHPFRGVLYAGLMITKDGPKVLEYNARFGDPECQPLLLRLKSDLASLMLAAARGDLASEKLEFRDSPALGIVLAASGYPGNYEKGQPITGMDAAEKNPDVLVFHAGTNSRDGRIISNGGRVLCVTALGENLAEARDNAYAALGQIKMPNGHFRRDIGQKGIDRLEAAAKKAGRQ